MPDTSVTILDASSAPSPPTIPSGGRAPVRIVLPARYLFRLRPVCPGASARRNTMEMGSTARSARRFRPRHSAPPRSIIAHAFQDFLEIRLMGLAKAAQVTCILGSRPDTAPATQGNSPMSHWPVLQPCCPSLIIDHDDIFYPLVRLIPTILVPEILKLGESRYYETRQQSGSCVACPENSITANAQVGLGSCHCYADFYGELNSTSASGAEVTECSSCPSNSNSPNNSATRAFCTCNEGYAGDPYNYRPCLRCTDIDANSYPWTSSLECACNKGYYGMEDWVVNVSAHNLTNLTCYECGMNSYNDRIGKVGAASCLQCPEHSTTLMQNGSDTVDDCHCDAGYFKQIDSGTTSCVPCPLHTYNPNTSATDESYCTGCPRNSVTVGTANTQLSACICVAGFYGLLGNCTQCPAGTHRSSDGATRAAQCLACTANSRSTPNSTECECDPGYYGNPPGSVDCEACPANTYQVPAHS
jgi:hypothetical protein